MGIRKSVRYEKIKASVNKVREKLLNRFNRATRKSRHEEISKELKSKINQWLAERKYDPIDKYRSLLLGAANELLPRLVSEKDAEKAIKLHKDFQNLSDISKLNDRYKVRPGILVDLTKRTIDNLETYAAIKNIDYSEKKQLSDYFEYNYNRLSAEERTEETVYIDRNLNFLAKKCLDINKQILEHMLAENQPTYKKVMQEVVEHLGKLEAAEKKGLSETIRHQITPIPPPKRRPRKSLN